MIEIDPFGYQCWRRNLENLEIMFFSSDVVENSNLRVDREFPMESVGF